MRITFVLDAFEGGGKERRCLQIIQGLNRTGINDIQVVLVNNGIAYKELYETSAIIEIIDRKNKGLNQLQTAKALNKLIKDYSPDIVQVWGLMSAGFLLLILPLLNSRFIASYVADADSPKGTFRIINAICNLVCDKVISNSKAGLIAYGTPLSKAVVIYNGFNENRFDHRIDKQSKKNELGINTPFVVSMVAVFRQEKDWQCYFDTAKIIVSQRTDITFLAVGKGPLWECFTNQISDNQRKYIRMLGRRDDVDEIYQISDLTVLLSNHGEGVSNSIMESMAWGVPVIATNNGGTPEIIKDNRTGRLINEQNPDVVSDMITSLIDDPAGLAQMGNNAADTVRRNFLLQRMTDDYVNLYNEICQ